MHAAWYLMVAFLPVSSLPLIAHAVGSNSVAGASGIFLLILLVGGVLPLLIQGKRLPGQLRPIIGFTVWALLITLASHFSIIPGFKDFSPLRNQVESLVTLAIGLSFFLVSSLWIRDANHAIRTMQVINWSGAIMLAWCVAQAVVWATDHRYPEWMRDAQDLLSMGVLYRQRVTGFALEPSWLAHMLNLVYLPYWLAATIRRTSMHRWRILGVSFENILLVGGLGALWLSYSRVGLLGAALMVAVLFWRLNLWLVRILPVWLENKSFRRKTLLPGYHKTVLAGIIFVLLLVYLAAAFGGLTLLSKVDPRMADVFRVDFFAEDNPLLRYANALKFGERVVYWQTGWNIFTDHPLMGVGLGNAGFYFTEEMPAYGWFLTEIRRLYFRENVLLNIKSLWVRLLAETGLIGVVFLLVWLIMILFTARTAESHTDRRIGSIGLMGVLALAALIAEGFSIDSFALPYVWFTAGIVTSIVNIDKTNHHTEGVTS